MFYFFVIQFPYWFIIRCLVLLSFKTNHEFRPQSIVKIFYELAMVSVPTCQIDMPNEGRVPFTKIKGAYSFTASRYADFRGDYVNLDSGMAAVEAGTAISKKNVVRGFHCSPFPKIVGCLAGSMWDVLVDLRPNSSTFMQSESILLKSVGMSAEADVSEAPTYVYVPPGVGHAYLALEDNTLTLYYSFKLFIT